MRPSRRHMSSIFCTDSSDARNAPHRAQTSPYSTPMPLRHTPTFLPAGGRRACALAATAAGLVSELEQHEPPPSCALHRRQGVRARQHLTCPILCCRRDSHTHTHATRHVVGSTGDHSIRPGREGLHTTNWCGPRSPLRGKSCRSMPFPLPRRCRR